MMASVPASAQQFPVLPVAGSPRGIYVLFQDHRSALWLGTIDDVVCFDGARFYSLRQYGFPKETPNTFAEDSEGGIWIGTQGTDANGGAGKGGIYRYQAGRVQKIFSGDGLTVVGLAPGAVLASVGTELSGRPSFGDLYLFRGSGNAWSSTPMLARQVNHLTIDHEGDVLFPCPGGWCEIGRRGILDWTVSGGELDVRRHAGSALLERVLRDRFGCIWLRAEAFASYQCPADDQPKLIPQSVSRYDSSAHLEETVDGSIFMLVYLALGRPGSFRTASVENGLPAGMDTATVAKDGTIWIGSDSGLYRFMYPFRLESWDKDRGVPVAYSFAREGKAVFAADGNLLRLSEDRRRWETLPGSTGLAGRLAADPRGTLLAATDNFVAEFNSEGRILAKSRLPDDRSVDASVSVTRNGDIWLGRNGVDRVIRKGGEFMLRPENLPEDRIADLQYDSAHDTLWGCDGKDVVAGRNGAWRRITRQDGLLDLNCTSIGIEANGDVWVGYIGGAASWIGGAAGSHPVIHNYTQVMSRDPVSNSNSHFLSVDGRGWLWFGTHILRVATSDSAKTGAWMQLDERDGIPPPWADGHSFLADTDGSVWFGTRDGITHFSPPDNFASDFPAPDVFVAGFTLPGAAPVLAETLGGVPHGREPIAHIGSLQFDRRNALRFRYRLLPSQPEWKETDSFDLPLGKLAPGAHTLEVQGRMMTGEWSGTHTATFHVLLPVWLSWPYLLAAGAGGAGAGAGAWRWRHYQRAMRAARLPDISAWRLSALSPEVESLVGTVVDGRYAIGHILSVGGFATVARARDLGDGGKLCAIKIFRYELGDQSWVRHRFEQEVTALEQLEHPNIVRITGHGQVDSGAPYLAMEFIAGRSLRELLDEERRERAGDRGGNGGLTRAQTSTFTRQLAEALTALHRRSIYHRDLKPENLMIRADADNAEQLVLIDFSIAIVRSPDETFHGISRVAGTLGYMAPEQVIGYADATTDIYALAKVVMEMLTGSRWMDLLPEGTLDMSSFLRGYLAANPCGLGAESVEMLAAALAFDPGRRPKTAAEFAAPIIWDLGRSS